METLTKYRIYPIEWDSSFEIEIKALYQMFRDQQSRIFSLDVFDNYDSIFDIIKDTLDNDRVFIIASDDGEIMASFILEDAVIFKDLITEVKIHCAIRRKYWGSPSRDICKAMREYLYTKFRIKKIIAEVPQCKYGVIKLLKDMGLKHEGTLKECLIYPDKTGTPKWYDKLIYTLTREDL